MAAVISATLHHPFTSIVVGPTQSGKSTFVHNLILNHTDYVDCEFDYILVFLGTAIEDNPTLKKLKEQFPDKTYMCKVLSEPAFDDSQELKSRWEKYTKYLENIVTEHIPSNTSLNGCLIFDDLMSELGRGEIS